MTLLLIELITLHTLFLLWVVKVPKYLVVAEGAYNLTLIVTQWKQPKLFSFFSDLSNCLFFFSLFSLFFSPFIPSSFVDIVYSHYLFLKNYKKTSSQWFLEDTLLLLLLLLLLPLTWRPSRSSPRRLVLSEAGKFLTATHSVRERCSHPSREKNWYIYNTLDGY